MTLYINHNQIKSLMYNRFPIIAGYLNGQMVFKANESHGFEPIIFNASDDFQEWVVPTGVTKIHVIAFGSKGADSGSAKGGAGGKVECDMQVTPGQTLYIMVGKIPVNSSSIIYNATDIRTNNTGITDNTSLQSRLLVAGGGGSGSDGSYLTAGGGAGGGLVGANGSINAAHWGSVGGSEITSVSTGGSTTNEIGGNGAAGYSSGYRRIDNIVDGKGSFGLGGSQKSLTTGGSSASFAGTGGAGYYGGGGGISANFADSKSHGTAACGGGGGSSYTDSNLCSNVVHTQGVNNGEGYLEISLPSVTLTVDVTPADATLILTSAGYTQSGNSITVPSGTKVSYNLSKQGYETLTGTIIVSSNDTISMVLKKYETLTINPTPSDATVTLTAQGYTQSGNSIRVAEGTVVSYTVSRNGYASETDTYTAGATDHTINVSLVKNNYTLTVNTTPADATVNFDTGTISGHDCTVPYDTEINYTISKTGYITSQTYTYTVTQTESVSAPALEPVMCTLTINPTPSDATVTLTAQGYTQSGNSIRVAEGTTVRYEVSKTNYITKSGATTVNTTNTLNVSLHSNTYYNGEGGTVSGGDYWNSRVNTFRASNSGTITYTNTMPAGTWNYQYKCQKQNKVTTHNVTMTITYTDNTTLTVFSKSDYPDNNGSEPNVYTGSFNATKPWKKMTISSNSQASNTSWCYLMVGPVVYISYVG